MTFPASSAGVSGQKHRFPDSPETGTLATIPFYVLGVGLIGLFFVLRRRSQRAEQTADN